MHGTMELFRRRSSAPVLIIGGLAQGTQNSKASWIIHGLEYPTPYPRSTTAVFTLILYFSDLESWPDRSPRLQPPESQMTWILARCMCSVQLACIGMEVERLSFADCYYDYSYYCLLDFFISWLKSQIDGNDSIAVPSQSLQRERRGSAPLPWSSLEV
ncbi:hypothetical protein BJY04DRAFT_177365 [Aspergillus karnatakaensis]|uniref:uncharacterized protein n=1 Tax=Aspergillus karnatakaensis TaxID=1810916 RepID=UPI003CCDC76D